MRGGRWHGYRTGCKGCEARAVARSQAAFLAIRKNEPGDLRDMIARLFPSMSYEDARRAVWAWWLVDHPEDKPATGKPNAAHHQQEEAK